MYVCYNILALIEDFVAEHSSKKLGRLYHNTTGRVYVSVEDVITNFISTQGNYLSGHK